MSIYKHYKNSTFLHSILIILLKENWPEKNVEAFTFDRPYISVQRYFRFTKAIIVYTDLPDLTIHSQN